MKIYLAGPHADYDNIWKKNKNTPKDAMKIFLAIGSGGNSAYYQHHETLSGEYIRENLHDNLYSGRTSAKKKDIPFSLLSGQDMKLFLTEGGPCLKSYIKPTNILNSKIAILESFYYVKDWMLPYIQQYWDFILDSGAYTYMTGKKNGGNIDWDDYINRYAEFINAQKIDLFFELDIDNVVGLKEVERLRAKLEAKTGKQPIVVWHKSRGKEAFLYSCKQYPYIALGGIVAKEFARDEYKYFPWFIDIAHDYGAKIHGLGFTNLKLLPQYHFDSVDSTAWIYGNMTGKIYFFNGKTIISHNAKEGERLKSSKETAIHNFREWVKFQQYAAKYL